MVPVASPDPATTRIIPPVLVLGYGNPGRLDDGLGPAFCTALADRAPSGVVVRSAVQLVVEDAVRVARFASVIFVDAALPDGTAFAFGPVPEVPGRVAFSSHMTSPEALMALARTLYGARSRGWTLAIRGDRFHGFGEGLSRTAQAHLHGAAGFLLRLLTDPPGPPAAPAGGSSEATVTPEQRPRPRRGGGDLRPGARIHPSPGSS